jgi:hypothetical protein
MILLSTTFPIHYTRTTITLSFYATLAWATDVIKEKRTVVQTAHKIPKITVFCHFTPCSVVDIQQRLGGMCYLQLQGILLVKKASSSEMLVNIYQTTHIPEDSNHHSHRGKKITDMSADKGCPTPAPPPNFFNNQN